MTTMQATLDLVVAQLQCRYGASALATPETLASALGVRIVRRDAFGSLLAYVRTDDDGTATAHVSSVPSASDEWWDDVSGSADDWRFRFRLAHELGHVALAFEPATVSLDEEQLCDAFADRLLGRALEGQETTAAGLSILADTERVPLPTVVIEACRRGWIRAAAIVRRERPHDRVVFRAGRSSKDEWKQLRASTHEGLSLTCLGTDGYVASIQLSRGAHERPDHPAAALGAGTN